MMKFDEYFAGKKITVVGLGLLGRGIGDIRFLAQTGAKLIVTDLKSEEELKHSVEALAEFPDIEFHLGGHRLEDFRDRDLIIKGPKVPMHSPYIAEARNNNIPVTMSTALFVKLSGMPTIGVTGTRGKSTVTHMIYDIVRRSGRHVLLGGNVVGISTLALLPEARPDGIAVLELDSWQLQGFAAEKVSPNIAVFTTFLEDHMDYYCGSPCPPEKKRAAEEAYLADKANIFLYQKEGDALVVGLQAVPFVKAGYSWRFEKPIIVADPARFPDGWDMQLLGRHNRSNAVCAIEAARALGIDDNTIKGAVADFRGMPGRLELLRERMGVSIYNDTTATTPQATEIALRALCGDDKGVIHESGKRNIVLIMGGADKGLSMDALLALIPLCCKKVVLLEGTGTDRVLEEVKKSYPDATVYSDLGAAVAEAKGSAVSGDCILFSPAFASFGLFENEYDRGAQFSRMVKTL